MAPRRASCENPSAVSSIQLRNLTQIPNFVRDPELYPLEIKYTYQQIRLDMPKMLHHMKQTPDGTRMQANFQAGTSLLLSLALIFNSLLRIFDPLDTTLLQDSANFSDESVALAERAMQYRPLGASHILVCLVAALAATDEDPARNIAVERMLLEYQGDFTTSKWMNVAAWLRGKYADLRNKLWMHSEFEESFEREPEVQDTDD